MSAADGKGYKRTLFDKYGPEAADQARIASWLIVPIVAGGGIGAAWFVQKGFSAAWVITGALLGAVLGGAALALVATSASQGGGALLRSFIQPGGTAMDRQYSLEDAMVMRGDVESALASYEKIILESPNDPQPRIRAAELLAKSGMRDRAENLLRSVQRLPGVPARDHIFAPNRLVDLYLAWPGSERKGLRELRRLIDTYPETPAAKRAR